tara:strand:+ start:3394 stop:5376 length:1983 start_codon:yes stop_codon:yes gene_type:complete
MKDIMSNSGGFTSTRVSAMSSSDPGSNNNYIWTTEKINKLISDINEGVEDIRKLKNSPFKDNDISLKREKLPFEYTPDEIEELAKCKSSPVYFAFNHCVIQTNDGRMLIKEAGGLRDFQSQIIKSYNDNNLSILMASRQTGKTVTSAIFMLWYLLFHVDKTALCVADNFSTTKELIDKFKISLEGLPFYMKPGIESINASSIKFDSKSRIVGRTTTKKSGIGLSVNLLYVDEFAHINESNIDDFYRAIFPTVTADPNGKIIITSTPNGKNKFWEIWKDAVNRDSNYVPLRVDWWQVAGRDEQWKKDKIADLGSIEDFNQEYGLQFFASDKLLLNSRDLKRLDIIKQEYKLTSIPFSEELSYIGESLFFHEKYSKLGIPDFKNDPANYVFSIDTADGIGGDYSILNIYKVVPLPINQLLKKRHLIKDEIDTISIVQIGYLRSNNVDINEFTLACEYVIYNIFNPDQTRIVIELNHKGDILLDRLSSNDNYWQGQIVATKHTQASEKYKPGLRLGPTNKLKYCEKFKYMITINRIIPNDELTINELSCFGRSKGGIYRGQNGNDDLAMTSVNASSLFDSSQFWDIAVETYERSDPEYQKMVVEKIFNLNSNDTKSTWDFDELRRMNNTGYSSKKHDKSDVNIFNSDTINHLKNLRNNFFKNK